MSLKQTGLLAIAVLIGASSVAMAQDAQTASSVSPQPQQQAAYNAQQQATWNSSHNPRQALWQAQEYMTGPYDVPGADRAP